MGYGDRGIVTFGAVLRWSAYGMDCAIVPGPSANLNGYVRLDENHPDRNRYCTEIPVRVHGGLTYGPDEGGWVGFDTARAGDAAPKPNSAGRRWTVEDVRRETEQLAWQLAARGKSRGMSL